MAKATGKTTTEKALENEGQGTLVQIPAKRKTAAEKKAEAEAKRAAALAAQQEAANAAEKGEEEEAAPPEPPKPEEVMEDPSNNGSIVGRYTKNVTIRTIMRNHREDLLNFDMSIQRGKVWKDMQKAELIHSIVYNYIIPPVIASESEDNDNVLHMLDGKQRLTTIIDFVNDELILCKDAPKCLGITMEGKKFSELPERMKEMILDFEITFNVMKASSESMVAEQFRKANNGSVLTTWEKVRSEIGSNLMNFLNKVSQHRFWQMTKLTPQQRVRFIEQEITLAAMKIFDEGTSGGISSSELRKYALHICEHGVRPSIVERIEKTLDYLADLPIEEKKAKEIFKKIHIPSVFSVVSLEQDKAVFAEHIYAFLHKPPYSYKAATGGGSAKASAVKARIEEIGAHFKGFNYPVTQWEQDEAQDVNTEAEVEAEEASDKQ